MACRVCEGLCAVSACVCECVCVCVWGGGGGGGSHDNNLIRSGLWPSHSDEEWSSSI